MSPTSAEFTLYVKDTISLHRDESGGFVVRQMLVADAHGLGEHEYLEARVNREDAEGMLRDGLAYWDRRVNAFPRSPRLVQWTSRRAAIMRALEHLAGVGA